MKLSKKFITAIGMLTLSAVMLTTSSFAWFSMNTNVSATGMQVTAKGDQVYLQISNGTAVYDTNGDAGTSNKFSNKVSMTTAEAVNKGTTEVDGVPTPIKYLPVAAGSAAVNPVYTGKVLTTPGSVTDLGATSATQLKWFTNVSKTTEGSAASIDYEEVQSANLANYCLINTFYLRLNPAAGLTTATQPLTSTVALVSAPDEALAETVSVVIVCGNYAQVWKQSALDTWYLDGGDKQLTADKFANPIDTEGVEVKVYIYFDGENAKCTTANITSTSYQVQVNFDVSMAPAA